MVKVQFMVPDEKKSITLRGSKGHQFSDMAEPPPIGFEVTEEGSGTKYGVVSVQDVRGGRLVSNGELEFVAELVRM
jgi:hypothetical protein